MAKGKKALGRALEAIIPEFEEGPELFLCPVEDIESDPEQPRRKMDEESLGPLSESIKKNGVLQPIGVIRKGTKYRIVFGERRWRAATMAGLERIPAILLNGKMEAERLKLSLIENLMRKDLTPIETAEGFKRLHDKLGLSHEEIGKIFGLDRSTVTNTIRLLLLPSKVKEMVEKGEITAGHARALLSLDNPSLMVELAKKVKEKGLSVRELEKTINKLKSESKKTRITFDQETVFLTRKVEKTLGLKIKLKGTPEKPKMEISFGSPDLMKLFIKRLLESSGE